MLSNIATIVSAKTKHLRNWSVGICFAFLASVVSPSLSMSAEDQTRSQGQAFATMSGGVNLEAMKSMLRGAEGIGLWTKLKLERRINRFTEDFYWYHKDTSGKSLMQMHERFIALHSRVVTLLEPRNPGMSKTFSDARDTLWSAFRNPGVFSSSVGKNVALRIEASQSGDANQY